MPCKPVTALQRSLHDDVNRRIEALPHLGVVACTMIFICHLQYVVLTNCL
jgi:hypothetical protein